MAFLSDIERFSMGNLSLPCFASSNIVVVFKTTIKLDFLYPERRHFDFSHIGSFSHCHGFIVPLIPY